MGDDQDNDWFCVSLSIACNKMVQSLLKLIDAVGERRPLLPYKMAVHEAGAAVLMADTNHSPRDKSAKDVSWEARQTAIQFPDVVESIETLTPLLKQLSALTKRLDAHQNCDDEWKSDLTVNASTAIDHATETAKNSDGINGPGAEPPERFWITVNGPRRLNKPVIGTKTELGAACHFTPEKVGDRMLLKALNESVKAEDPKIWVRKHSGNNYEAYFLNAKDAAAAQNAVDEHRVRNSTELIGTAQNSTEPK